MKFKEYLNESNKDYIEWKGESDKLNKSVTKLSDILQKFQKNSSGQISDEIKNSDEFKKAKKEYNLEFKKLQNFNKSTPKDFLRQASKDRRSKWKN